MYVVSCFSGCDLIRISDNLIRATHLIVQKELQPIFCGGGGLVSIHIRTTNSVCKTAHNREGRFAAREASKIFTLQVCHQSVTCHTDMLSFTAKAIPCSEACTVKALVSSRQRFLFGFVVMTSRHGCT